MEEDAILKIRPEEESHSEVIDEFQFLFSRQNTLVNLCPDMFDSLLTASRRSLHTLQLLVHCKKVK